jgi:hypothetical protein
MFSPITFRAPVNTYRSVANTKAGDDDGGTKTKPTTEPPVRTIPAEPLPSPKPAIKPCSDPDKSGCEF